MSEKVSKNPTEWKKTKEGWLYRIDGDEIIFNFKNGSWYTVLPLSSDDLKGLGLSSDYYETYNGKFVDLLLGFTFTKYPWTGQAGSTENNKLSEEKFTDEQVSIELGISEQEYINFKNKAKFIFYCDVLKKIE